MSNVLRLAIVDPNDANRESLKSMLLGLDSVWLEAECSRYEYFSDVVAQTDPDIGMIALDEDPEKGMELIEKLRSSVPRCNVFVVSSSSDGAVILGAMRAGAKEFLTAPLKVEDLLSSLDRIEQQRAGDSAGKSRASAIYTIAGASGGVGSTSIAVNLACALAKDSDKSVALIDLDTSLGDADVLLDTIPDYTLADVSQNVSRLDFTLLKRSLTKHSSGLHLLPRPVHLHESLSITPDDVSRVIGLMKATFSHLIIDTSKAYTPLDMLAMEEADQVLLITQLDLPCLRNVVRLMMSFEETVGLKEKIRVVVNRIGLDSGQISLKKAQETIGTDVFWQVPNDYRVMSEVRNNGVPLVEQAPKAGITQAIMALAATISGESAVTDSDDRAGIGKWLNFWPPKKKEAASSG